MSDNSEIILSQVLQDQNEAIAPEMSPPDFFEAFCAEQATKEYELSYEEIQAGIVDGEHDGGIDSFYTFLDGECVGEEVGFTLPKKSAELEVVIIQSKSTSGFSETPIDKMISSLRRLLSLSQDFNELTQYNSEVKSRADIFRKSYKRLASKFPSLKIKVIYACTKSITDVHQNTQLKAQELVTAIRSLFDEAEVNFEFWGAKELLILARTKPTQSFELTFDQSLNGSNGYVALVKLRNFYRFLLGGGSEIRSDLFEANVRDYQGSTEVNQEISNTLESGGTDDFWWFNNGVTILASRASSGGSIITIENPQIVNGLQTSSEIGRFFSNLESDDSRSVMVKVVASENEEVRDKIIKATNSQNQVPLASLRATDKIQRDIEHHLKANGYFYDRRKNLYKNEGKPAAKIISIALMAQAVMTLFRGEPDNARARPSSLIKDDAVYSSIFSDSFALDAYLVAASTIRMIELKLKETDGLVARDRNNIRFYVLFWVCALKSKSISLNADRVSKLKDQISGDDVSDAISEVWQLFSDAGGTDQTAKGPSFKEEVKDKVKNKIQALFQQSEV
ncbi:hypothetical protein BFP70_05620 [Thioclava sp. SK-1]|uniref:AIPR family protein n=1 Tax=Thioclava sp. SK-1 TaxID=1889770 RepID=UPI00082414F0|nr:AIPR family protein [Thioclava sp. SK-1]OCX66347.1 hypothetical protein BFP70_05620 [Thioclava sp. SK-1]